MLIKSNDNLNSVVDHLVFYLDDGENIDLFLKVDQNIWNPFLEQNDYFVSKEVWINDNNKGEIHILNTWVNYDKANNFDIKEKEIINSSFKEAFPFSYQLEKKRDDYNKPILIKYNEAYEDGK